MARIRFAGKTVNLPRSRIVRIVLGLLLIVGGFLGFLPVLGFWMVPLGLIVLSVDVPFIRRQRRKFQVWWERRKARRVKKASR